MRLLNIFVSAFVALLLAHIHCADVPARTQSEVDAIIENEGSTKPPWLDATKLNFPPTLLLHWEQPDPKKKEPWTPNKYLGQYIWSTINENSGRWKEGVRLMYHLLEVNKDEPANLVKTKRALAKMYTELLQDYARGAYWWKQSGVEKAEEDEDLLPLAFCYAQLGNKDYPRKVLNLIKKDFTRHGDVIKLWTDIGDYEMALKTAGYKAEEDDADVAYLMAGETCRRMGKFGDAIDYFKKCIAAPQPKCGRDFKQSKARAQASINAVKLYDSLDLNKIADGNYSSESQGYTGPVAVAVTVKDHKIEGVKVTRHTEKQYYGSLTATPAQIIAKQSVKGIDTYSSATITSEAIVNATAKALSQGLK